MDRTWTCRSASRSASKTPSPESVIFLDVDGVLHSLYGDDIFRETCCGLLEHILRQTGAAIVLSSTWRRDPGKVGLINGMLRSRRLAPVLDSTPDFVDGRREHEICDWLDRHPHVWNWIAIDDMDLLGSDSEACRRLRGHVVRTSADTGLTPRDAEQAVVLLRSASGAPSSPSLTPTTAAGTPSGTSPSSPQVTSRTVCVGAPDASYAFGATPARALAPEVSPSRLVWRGNSPPPRSPSWCPTTRQARHSVAVAAFTGSPSLTSRGLLHSPASAVRVAHGVIQQHSPTLLTSAARPHALAGLLARC